MKKYQKEELEQFNQQQLIDIVLELQNKLDGFDAMSKQLDDLRGQIADQAMKQEVEEENEMNTFRRLSVECMERGLPVEMPQERAGQAVDQCGSLNDVTVRKEPVLASFAQFSSTSNGQRDFQQANQVMSMSLQSQKLSLNTSAQPRQAPPMGSYSSAQLSSGTPRPALQLNMGHRPPVPIPTPGTAGQKFEFRPQAVTLSQVPKVEDEDSDRVEVII